MLLQETTTISSQVLLLSNLVAIILSVVGTISAQRFMRRREPAEVAKIDAERSQVTISTTLAPQELTLEAIKELREFSEAAERRRVAWVAREETLVDQRNEWRRKFEQLEFDSNRRLVKAEADAQAAIMFMDQLHAAANLAKVRLADYTPKQLKDEIERMKATPPE